MHTEGSAVAVGIDAAVVVDHHCGGAPAGSWWTRGSARGLLGAAHPGRNGTSGQAAGSLSGPTSAASTRKAR